jgi:predicted nucleic acid-binding protein
MTALSEPAFVDTNVLVYVYESGTDPRRLTARTLLGELMSRKTLRLSVQVLQELYVTLVRKSRTPGSAELIAEWIADLARWPVQGIDYPLVAEAMRLSRTATISYWDALVVSAAARSGAKRLYSEDLNHGQVLLGVEVVNPFAA